MPAYKLFPQSTSYSYMRHFQIANNKRPMTFCHRMDRALLPATVSIKKSGCYC
nr:unnamed protein product [Callosobruchus chinensis]